MNCRQWAVNGGGVGLTDSAVLIGDVRPRATTDLSGPAWPTFDVTIRLILLLSQTAVCLYLKALLYRPARPEALFQHASLGFNLEGLCFIFPTNKPVQCNS